MDKAADKARLDNELAMVEAYRQHPLTQRFLKENAEEQEKSLVILCEQPIHNIETFFAHFECVGHLRALRRDALFLRVVEAEIQDQIETL